METIKSWVLGRFVQVREASQGQGYVEYILIIGLVGLVTTTALIAFQGQIATALSNIGTKLIAD